MTGVGEKGGGEKGGGGSKPGPHKSRGITGPLPSDRIITRKKGEGGGKKEETYFL